MRNLDSAIRKNTKTKACKCPFAILVEYYDFRGWAILTKPGDRGKHNHAMAIYPEGHRQMSGLSPASKKIVKDMTAAQAKPAHILAAIKEQVPDDKPTSRHVYNCREDLRKASFEDRDVVGQFYHLAVENNYVHWTDADQETHAITHLFMAHPDSVQLLRTYHWFIGLDSTYKTNRYKFPLVEIIGMTPSNKNFMIAYAIMKDETDRSYRWVLHKLRFLLGDLRPTTIVTDRELGLMTPIMELFSDTAHLLCTWHINKDVEERVYNLCGKNRTFAERVKNGKWRRIMQAPTEIE